jgi:hypothetical protein
VDDLIIVAVDPGRALEQDFEIMAVNFDISHRGRTIQALLEKYLPNTMALPVSQVLTRHVEFFNVGWMKNESKSRGSAGRNAPLKTGFSVSVIAIFFHHEDSSNRFLINRGDVIGFALRLLFESPGFVAPSDRVLP